MARTQSIGVREHLNSLTPPRRLRQLARETGALQRQRKVDVVALFWTLVLGFGTGRERSFAGLRRLYEATVGRRLVPSAFWDRFNPALARFLKRVAQELMTKLCEPLRQPDGVLAGFRDLVVTDSTVLRLHRFLKHVFPGCRTNHTQAAAKLHVVMSVLAGGPRSVKVTSERAHDGKTLEVGPWVKGRLLLVDLGYYRFQLFDCIRRNGGYFITRLKENGNPLIVGLHRLHRGQAVDVVGHRLQDVLPRLQRQALDAEVEVRFQHRVYRGTRTWTHQTFRLVAVRDAEAKDYHLYLTNVPPDRLDPEDVARTYRARWSVELLFAEMKSGYGLDELPTRKRAAVEVFVYATLITLIASRRLLAAVRRKHGKAADRVGPMRWARVFCAYAQDVLRLVVATPPHAALLARSIEPAMFHEALDPHLHRPGLIQQVENRAG